MAEYRRSFRPGGCYFFTQVTYRRMPWLCAGWARQALRKVIEEVRRQLPFVIEAWVLLPQHLHCIGRLPEGDPDYSTRWRLIKTSVTKHRDESWVMLQSTGSREKGREQTLWQRRFWEHTIRDAEDYGRHCDYIHFNPVKHGLRVAPREWPYSTFHRFVKAGRYEPDWGSHDPPESFEGIGHE
ncbi:MAG: transposase [Acidobacteria bacterium]|nr:transposase [Acidobacteriota bacterium]